jgi:alkylated DNA nucleotide flippase Atl1
MPPEFAAIMIAFEPLFSKRVFEHALVLVAGAILTPGRRTVTNALRIMGRSQETTFQNYHRVLNRARWSAAQASRILLALLVRRFAPEGPLVFGIDDTIERRWGKNIQARGIYRDPVRSSHGHFVKASGLRWLSLMLLCEMPWADRAWALPFLTVLCPSQRYHQARGKTHKKLTDYARQLTLQLRRWLPDRSLIIVGDSSFAALELLASVRAYATMVTRLRLDAALYEPAPPRRPGQMGRPRKKGKRLPTLKQVLTDSKTPWLRVLVSHWYGRRAYEVEITSATAVWFHTGMTPVPLRWVLVRDPAGKLDPKAFLCTDLEAAPLDILRWFVRRWQVEVTFEEARRHLGVETQRQWSTLAIARTTPCLFALFSLVTLMADRLHRRHGLFVRQAAWYAKALPTFSDALAAVRRHWWHAEVFHRSGSEAETVQISRMLFNRLTGALCYAA